MNYRTSEKEFHDKIHIFFCSTTHDFFRYFDDISKELFNYKSKIAIWYPSYDMRSGEPIREIVDYESLGFFKMCVVPVTAELLDTDNPAKREMMYALKNDIPVLPLIQEEGLSERFNAVFGNIQYFDKYLNKSDETQLPYEEKLKLFLDRTLPTDDLVERVRAFHKARLFLSYRKKDRLYANNLLKFIHSDAGFQTVAVWYDEFLVAGDDYSNEIKEAMRGSDAVLLLVTPGILEEDNYVMRVEYPDAVKMGKKIIPIEMFSVDRNLLAEKFPGIGEVISFREGERILEALGEIFDRESLSIDSPEELFLLACAYLYGIDMEISYKKAEDFLTKAAEDGFMEAYEKLIDSYFKGVGVVKYQQEIQKLMLQADFDNPEYLARLQDFVDSRDCIEPNGEKVVFWGEKYLELIDEKYPGTKDPVILEKIAYVRDKVGRMKVIKNLNDLSLGKTSLQELGLQGSGNEKYEMTDLPRPSATEKIEFREEKVSNEEAVISDLNYYKYAEEFYEQCYREKGKPEVLKLLVEIYEHLGYLYQRFLGDDKLAAEYFDKADKVKERIE